MRRLPSYVAALALPLALAACGTESPEVATDEVTTSASPDPGPTDEPTEPSEEPEPEPSVDPEPAVVGGIDVTFDQQALTVTMDVPELVETDRLLMMYEWQTRDVDVAVETVLVGGQPRLNAVWTDYNTEMSGKIRDVDAAWDLEAGTVTITLREKLNGRRAEVAAFGLGPKDRYPVEPPAGAVTGTATRG